VLLDLNGLIWKSLVFGDAPNRLNGYDVTRRSKRDRVNKE
jgi:hypothetical protein